jgi:aldose 1-epimerase
MSFRIHTLKNGNGIQARILDYGACLMSLRAPGRKGDFADVVAGFDTAEEYTQAHPYFGVTVGRYANRIGGGRFVLNGVEHTLARNDGANHLHGGTVGFDKAIWKIAEAGAHSILLQHLSPDGDEGYPGNLAIEVRYTLADDDALRIDYRAVTDRDTVVNFTNHSYFNLRGAATDVLGHEVYLNADRFTPAGAGLIPTGEFRSVEGTPFDFHRRTPVGARIEADDEQLRAAGGYDHNWVLNRTTGGLTLAARVYEPESGRVLDVETTEPGIQFYTGNFLDGTVKGKQGATYARRSALCLETQHYPDSPNRPEFPSTVLKAGDTYRSTTVYRFLAR